MEQTPQGSGPKVPPEAPPSDLPPTQPSSQQSSNRPIMLVLSYLGLLALIPLLVEKEDPEVQWHAKNGLLMFAGVIVLFIALAILSYIPVIGTVIGCGLLPILWIVIIVIHIVAMVKALKGDRLIIPFVSEYVDQWK